MSIFDIILIVAVTVIFIGVLIHSMIDTVNMNNNQQKEEYIKQKLKRFKEKELKDENGDKSP